MSGLCCGASWPSIPCGQREQLQHQKGQVLKYKDLHRKPDQEFVLDDALQMSSAYEMIGKAKQETKKGKREEETEGPRKNGVFVPGHCPKRSGSRGPWGFTAVY